MLILKELKDEDKPQRVALGKWFCEAAHTFFEVSRFFFSDESNFYLELVQIGGGKTR